MVEIDLANELLVIDRLRLGHHCFVAASSSVPSFLLHVTVTAHIQAVVLVEIRGRSRRYFPPEAVSRAGSSDDGPSTSGSGLTTDVSDFLRSKQA